MTAALVVLLLGQYGVSGFAADPKVKASVPKAPQTRITVPIAVPAAKELVPVPEPIRASALTEADVVAIVRRELAAARTCRCRVPTEEVTPAVTVQGCRPERVATFTGTEPGSVLVFSSARCEWCHRLERESLARFAMAGKHLHRVDAGDPANAACVAHYEVSAYPTIVVIDAPGRYRKHEGYLDPAGFSAFVAGGVR